MLEQDVAESVTAAAWERAQAEMEAARERRRERLIAAGQRGGEATAARHGAEYYAALGRRGGATTRERHGQEHYRRIGRMGGLSGRGTRKRRAAPPEA